MFTEDVEPMAPEIAAAFNAGAREGLLDALNLLWKWTMVDGVAEAKRAHAAYCKLRNMIDAEFPAPDDSEEDR